MEANHARKIETENPSLVYTCSILCSTETAHELWYSGLAGYGKICLREPLSRVFVGSYFGWWFTVCGPIVLECYRLFTTIVTVNTLYI